MKSLRGLLSISRTQGGNHEETSIRITLEDDQARCRVVEVRMSLEAFAEAITGSGWTECFFEFNDSGKVGTVGQNKEERVPIPRYEERASGWETTALAPFEVDGWKARHGDITNRHRHSRDAKGQDYQSVVFFRNVPVEAAAHGEEDIG